MDDEEKMRGDKPFSLVVAAVIMTLVGALGCSLLPTPETEPEIEFEARKDAIERGECTYLE